MSTRPATLQGRPASGGGFLTRKVAGVPGWAWVVVAAGGAFLIIRFIRSKSAAASTTATGSAQQPTVVYTTTAGGTGSGGSSGGGSGGGGTYTPPGAPTPPPAASSTSTTAAGTKPQTITIGGQRYDVLGTVGGKTGYTVAGGAPVYFGNANAIAQGPTAAKPGAYEYTPVGNANLIYKRGTPNPPA